eukprot:Rhum_TRINITY_DN22922_c0_g1::Rhum_TRINITY_DN22922_c0_g1_i1::g.176532::m.176532
MIEGDVQNGLVSARVNRGQGHLGRPRLAHDTPHRLHAPSAQHQAHAQEGLHNVGVRRAHERRVAQTVQLAHEGLCRVLVAHQTRGDVTLAHVGNLWLGALRRRTPARARLPTLLRRVAVSRVPEHRCDAGVHVQRAADGEHVSLDERGPAHPCVQRQCARCDQQVVGQRVGSATRSLHTLERVNNAFVVANLFVSVHQNVVDACCERDAPFTLSEACHEFGVVDVSCEDARVQNRSNRPVVGEDVVPLHVLHNLGGLPIVRGGRKQDGPRHAVRLHDLARQLHQLEHLQLVSTLLLRTEEKVERVRRRQNVVAHHLHPELVHHLPLALVRVRSEKEVVHPRVRANAVLHCHVEHSVGTRAHAKAGEEEDCRREDLFACKPGSPEPAEHTVKLVPQLHRGLVGHPPTGAPQKAALNVECSVSIAAKLVRGKRAAAPVRAEFVHLRLVQAVGVALLRCHGRLLQAVDDPLHIHLVSCREAPAPSLPGGHACASRQRGQKGVHVHCCTPPAAAPCAAHTPLSMKYRYCSFY